MFKNFKTVLLSWSLLLAFVLFAVIVFYYNIKPVVGDCLVSNAEGEILLIADNVVTEIFDQSVTYDKISNVTRDENNRFTGIELNTKEVNRLKNRISSEIIKKSSKNEFIEAKIPIGTLFNVDLINGVGPKMTFSAQFSQNVNVDFKSLFESTGINQVLHQILLEIKLSGSIVSFGRPRGYSTSTTVIVAQTVIVGVVPDDFTDFSGGTLNTFSK